MPDLDLADEPDLIEAGTRICARIDALLALPDGHAAERFYRRLLIGAANTKPADYGWLRIDGRPFTLSEIAILTLSSVPEVARFLSTLQGADLIEWLPIPAGQVAIA